jgi:hypothetical protein
MALAVVLTVLDAASAPMPQLARQPITAGGERADHPIDFPPLPKVREVRAP